MPKFYVIAPDGKKYIVNAAEGGTLDGAKRWVHETYYSHVPQQSNDQTTIGAIGRDVIRGAGSLVSGLGSFIEEAPSYVIPNLAKAVVAPPVIGALPGISTLGDRAAEAVKPLAQAVQNVYEPGGKFEGDRFRQWGQDISGSVAPRPTKSFFDEDTIGGKIASLRDTVAESSIPTIAGMLTGALTKNPEVAMAVMGLSSLPQEYSGIRDQQKQTGDNDPAKAMEHALAVTFSDAALGAGGEATHLLTGRIAKGFAQDVMHGLKGWGRTALEEAATEALQNVIEQHGAGMDPTTRENLKQTLEAGLAGAMGAGVFGGAIAGINKVVESKAKAAVQGVEPLHQVQVEAPTGKGGATERQTVDILSRPDQTGAVLIRDQNGTPHRAPLEELQKMAVVDESGTKPDIAGAVEQAASARDAVLDQPAQSQEVATATPAPTPVAATPEEFAQELVTQRLTQHGLPESYAKKHAAKMLGLAPEEESATEPTAAPESEPAPQVEATAPVTVPETVQTENTAPAPAPVTPSVTYKGTTYSLEEAVDKYVSTPDNKKPKWLNEFVKANREAVSAEIARRQTEEAAQRNAELAQQYNLPTATEEEIAARDKNVSQELVTPPAAQEVPTVAETAATKNPPEAQAVPLDRKIAFAEANQRYPDSDELATMFYRGATNHPLSTLDTQFASDEALMAYHEGQSYAGVTPEEENQEANTPPEPGAEAPAETAPEVPVTKVAPGVARGVKETRRGQMGTQMGRPVEGAAALTEGNREEQKLYQELDTARSRREISDQEHADVLNFLRPPADEGALRAMPGEQRQQWLTAIAAQKNVDDWQAKLRDIPKEILDKPNPVYQDAEQELGKRQQSLDAIQREIVNTARKQAEKYARDRANARSAARRAFKRGEIDRREFNIRMHELAVRSAALPMKGDEALGYTPEAARAIEAAISDRGFAGALDYASKNARTPFEKELMGRLRATTRKLEKAGAKFDIQVVSDELTDSTYVNGELNHSMGVTLAYSDGGATVYLNSDSSGRPTGLSQGVLVHELVHAVTAPIMALHETFGTGNTKVDAAVKDLRDIIDKLREHLSSAVANDNETELESVLAEHGLQNEDELLAWALGSPDMQKLLSSINLTPRLTLFQKFVNAVRKMLGLDPRYGNALADVVRLSNKITNVSPYDMANLIHASFMAEHTPDPKLNAMAAPNVKAAQIKENAALQKVRLSQKNGDVFPEMTTASLAIDEKRNALMDAALAKGNKTFLRHIANTNFVLEWIARRGDGVEDPNGVWHNNTNAVAKEVQLMHGLRGAMRRAAAEADHRLTKFINRHGQLELSTTMFLARQISFDPRSFKDRADALANDPALVHIRQELAKMPPQPMNKSDAKARREAERQLKLREDDINTFYEHAWEPLGKQEGGHEQAKYLWKYFEDMYSVAREERRGYLAGLGLSQHTQDMLFDLMEQGDIHAEQEQRENKTGFSIPPELLPNMYFPHDRNGEYALSVKGDRSRPAQYYHKETALERNKLEAQIAKDMGLTRGTPEYDAVFKRLDGREMLMAHMSKEDLLFGQMMKLIDDKYIGSKDDALDLKDQLMQVYLLTAPERSLKRNLLHAKLTVGQDTDVGRVFRTNASKYSGSIPKAIHGPEIRRAMAQLEAPLEEWERDPQERLVMQNAVDVVKRNINQEMSPDLIGNAERMLNEVTFMAVMSSPASAAVQTLTLPTQVFNRMITIHGPVKALKAMGKYMATWRYLMSPSLTFFRQVDPVSGEEYLGMPTMRTLPVVKNNPLLSKAYDALAARAAFDVKGTTMLLQNSPTIATGRHKVTRGWQKIMNVSGAMFGAADHIAREQSALALFELHHDNLKDFDAAIDATIRDLNDTVGDYSTWNKPGMFRGGPLRRAFGYLRMWSLNRTMLAIKLFRDALRGSPYRTKKQAWAELSMTLLTSALAAGGRGMLGYSVVTTIIDLAQRLLFSDDELDKWKREDPLGALDSDYRFNYRFLPSILGEGPHPSGSDTFLLNAARRGILSATTGWDFSGRLSQSDLWVRPWIHSDKYWENAVNAFSANFSPHISNAMNVAGGMDDIGKGNWARGIAKMTPLAAARGPINAVRLGTEGEETSAGAKVMSPEEFSAFTLWGQAMGFTPAKLAEIREWNRAAVNHNKAMGSERNKLLDRYRDAVADHDMDSVHGIIAEMNHFNSTIPRDRHTGLPDKQFFITPSTLESSLRSSTNTLSKTVRGVKMSNADRQSYREQVPY